MYSVETVRSLGSVLPDGTECLACHQVSFLLDIYKGIP